MFFFMSKHQQVRRYLLLFFHITVARSSLAPQWREEGKKPAWQLTCTQMAAITMATLIVHYMRIHFWAQTEIDCDIWLWRNTGTSRTLVLMCLRSCCVFDRSGSSRQGPGGKKTCHASSLWSPTTITMALILDFPLFCVQLLWCWPWRASVMIEEEEEVEGKQGGGEGWQQCELHCCVLTISW